MTLTITLINEHGVWQSSDMRLTDPMTKKVCDDYSIKHVAFRCPDGAALLSYAGAGRVNGVHLSDWLRQFSRGQFSRGRACTLEETLVQIREQATEDLGELLLKQQVRHMFSVGAFLAGAPCVVQIRNFSVTGGRGIGPIQREFRSALLRVSKGTPGAPDGIVVPWPWEFLSQSDLSLLTKLSGRRPREPKEFSDLLATVNLRTAKSPKSQGLVSRHCVTTYLPPRGDGMQWHVHHAPAGSPPVITPMLLFGIDTTELQQHVRAMLDNKDKSSDLDRIAQEAVTTRNRLKRK